MPSTSPPLVLAAHGSRDPASSATMRALAARVGRVWRAPVLAAFLDFDEPSIPDALAALPGAPGPRRVRRGSAAGHAHGVPSRKLGTPPAPVVVPMLLTSAYHGRVDLPGVLASVPRPVRLAPVLGPDPVLVDALAYRLSDWDGVAGADGVALIAAGTSEAAARSTVDETAASLGRRLGVSCMVGYASAADPTVGEAVLALRAAGSRRILVASYFLACGLLYSAAAESALRAGAVAVAAPLGGTDELVRLVMTRARAGCSAGATLGPDRSWRSRGLASR